MPNPLNPAVPDISDPLVEPGGWYATEVWYRFFELIERAIGQLIDGDGNITVVSYVPLSMGTEPLTFVSTGSGQPVLVPFTDD